MIKIRDLEYLNAVDTYKHFGKAAEACHVSQPTLSSQIIKLEEQLGITLVERHRGNILLTPEGEQLAIKARKVLMVAQEFEITAKALNNSSGGELHLGLIPTLAPYLLPHIMPSIISDFEELTVFPHENQIWELLRHLDQGQLDVLIIPWLEETSPFDAYDLFEEPLMLAVGKQDPLADKESIKQEDLKGRQILMLGDTHCLSKQVSEYCVGTSADLDKRFQATSLETLRHLVEAGVGITLLPKLATIGKENSQNILYIPFADPTPVRRIVLLTRKNYTRLECVRQMVALIRKTFKNKVML